MAGAKRGRTSLLLCYVAAVLQAAGLVFAGEKPRSCKAHPALIGDCFTIHGRMRYYNGAPTVRILRVGTNRVLGVSEGRFLLPGYMNLPADLRALLDAQEEILP